MDLPLKPQKPPAAKRPKKTRSPQDERQSAALDKIAKNYRRVRVPERRKGPQFIAVLATLLVLALILYKMFGQGFFTTSAPAITDVAPEEADAAVAAGPIDPLPFREAIENFERPLLGDNPSPDLPTLRDSILGAGGKLAAELQLDRSAAAPRTAQALERSLAALAAKSPPRLEDFAQLRREWLQLRRREMLDASFLQNPTEPATGDQIALTAYRSQAAALDQALGAAFDRAAAYAREPEEPETPEERQLRLAGLDEVAAELRQQIGELRQAQPERPSGNLEPALMVAIQSLEQALAEAQSLAGSPANLHPEGRAAFANVEQLIGRTQSSLDQLGG